MPVKNLLKAFKIVHEAFSLLWEAAPRYFLLTLISMIFKGLTPVLIGLVTKLIVDRLVAKSGDNFQIWLLVLCEFILAAVASLSKSLSEYAGSLMRDRTQHKLRLKVDSHAASLDLDFFELPGNYDTFAKAQREIGTRPFLISLALFSIVEDLATVTGYFFVVLVFQPILAIALLLAGIPALIVTQNSKFLKVNTHNLMTPEGRKAAYFDDLLTKDTFAKEVRLFGIAPTILEWNQTYTQGLLKILSNIAAKTTFKIGFADVFSISVQYAALCWVILYTVSGNVTLGDFVLLTNAIVMVRTRIGSILSSLGDLYENTLFFSAVTEFLALKPKIVAPKEPKPVPEILAHGFVFENVSFSYPGSEVKVFDALNLELRVNQATALVGINGSGKTTLVKLLTRLYDPTEGRITLDGVDIREFDPIKYRQLLAVILQDFVQYQLSIKDNVILGCNYQPVDDARLLEAAKTSNITELVNHLPEAWDTLLGRQFHVRGQELSGGEWQRVALARVLYRNAPILILDEPTSAMDAITEAELFTNYRKVTHGKLSLLITHRFNTVEAANRILVIEHGQIIEDGEHSVLLTKKGRYYDLYSAQALPYLSNFASIEEKR